mmetsp:Transcript_4515/g.7908  ORF Transcript_4515/g.7908 Transcript_4515/m.7908 type:complete len:99 (+) Transcript_4515:64-360(+)
MSGDCLSGGSALESVIIVKFFAKTRELAGVSEITLRIPSEIELTIDLLIKEYILKQYPAIIDILPSCSIALNEEYVESISQKLKNSDEIAIIPPISGG